MFSGLVFTSFDVGVYEILIIQDAYGNLLSIKIDEYDT
tara:strand:- start:2493 stop:2606 length:114 start_codon:yes stop_codon:yes gene_type:complete